MTRIYTRSGDQGRTGLADDTRTNKSSVKIAAIGSVDECNSHLGMLISLIDDQTLGAKLSVIQHQLFDLGATLAGAPEPLIETRHVQVLEGWIDELEQSLPVLQQFILPGGNVPTAQAHIARSVCRRAERWVFKLIESDTKNETSALPGTAAQFLNRLSDYLFLVARRLSTQPTQDQGGEIPWLPEDKRG